MQFIKNILIATDFTKASKNLVDTAILLADSFHSNIYIIHVMPGEVKDKKSVMLMKEAAKAKMDEIVETIKSKKLSVKGTYIRQGNCVDAVIRAVDRAKANLIIIGSSSMAKRSKFKLGTTAEKIIRNSEAPVYVVKKSSRAAFKKIFCPVDFSEPSKRAIKDAVYMARTYKASLVVYSVYELYDKNFPRFDPSSGGMNKLAKTEHEQTLNDFLDSIETVGIDHKVVIRSGDPAKEILKGIDKHKPDLLIMGTSGKSGLSRWLMGSVAEKVTREVPCSFITVKSENILTVELETRVTDMEYHFKAAQELLEKGMFTASVEEFLVCLRMNDMHIPSLVGIAKAYEHLGKKETSANYRQMARSALAKMWDDKIQTEVLKHYSL